MKLFLRICKNISSTYKKCRCMLMCYLYNKFKKITLKVRSTHTVIYIVGACFEVYFSNLQCISFLPIICVINGANMY